MYVVAHYCADGTGQGALAQGATIHDQQEGKILFFSDRDGADRLYALDPATGELSWVTQEWPFAVAQAREGRSPDGRYAAEVQTVTDVTAADRYGNPAATQSTAVIFVRSTEHQKTRELTTHDRFSYDPA